MKVWKPFKIGMILLTFILVLGACGKTKDNGGSTPGGSAAPTTDTKTLDAIKQRGKFVVGVKFDTNLFGLKDPGTGQVNGFDIDISKAIAKKLLGDETKVELKEVTSKTRIPMLQKGDIDAIIATMTISEERKKEVDFTDVYFKAGQSLLVKKGSDLKSIDDVVKKKGVKVLTVKGSTSAKNIRAKAPDAQVLEFENYQEAFTALKSGKGEALTTDNAILYGMTKQDPGYEVVGGTFTDEPYGIAVRKGDAEFTKAVNDVLKELKDSGEYAKIYEKWIGEKPAE
ncbi:amino acid ABC transporter substrate-binding protein [Paenibacillus chitinolyticus]|uniref:Amino acid ABC transporter substrate-binding protein n=1 Tax=Paenibacillus chitinolyticus TaxID=79263 RepID=A0A410X033_9BACL|nr:transporter substrate-binding domain-containing protein [Paenibacillus chitinolyticus]MCY9592843.1 transporter substrate-binding domain-containing protein [Paenibacillus chitinolyticus]MCY9595964.1 transporter substrate-binding domain-containing protein [Paenibacillus chitinolyticus]QAV19970.1 amino acid ABC transporter substrate-binding protein [Paenibacillus chitinolyticus]